jgi:2-polyprenyl-3-methyl-5-hydroxy-6-metoxy-1,4-benzoquinol methylase
MKNIHQKSNATKYNRYPEIFLTCSNIKNNNPKILSFGCSHGLEVFSLKEKYFPNSIIHGLDINKEMISICNKDNKYKDIYFYNYDDFNFSEKYDIIFCMSVLCRWEDTKHVEDCSKIYSFKQFNSQLNDLDKLLNIGGLLVIYNSNFCFSDSELYNKYNVINSPLITSSGFVKKFNKLNKSLESEYNDCIFTKIK